MSERLEIVTIDGPSGVGKSTISRRLAARLGFAYLDTGAMYRAVALHCRETGTDPNDGPALAELLDHLEIRLAAAPSEEEDVVVLVNGRDVSQEIRTPEMSMLASAVSAIPAVRGKLTQLQQQIGIQGKIVTEGRDMGTVVFPQAAWKFFLEADPAERARRRTEQLRARGVAAEEKEILAQISKRDEDDQNRAIAPLKAAADAIHLDTTHLDIEGVLREMEHHIRRNIFSRG